MKLSEEKVSAVLGARLLALRYAKAHFHQTYPTSYRQDVVSELLDESVDVVLEKLGTETFEVGRAIDETEYIRSLSHYIFGVFKNKLRNFRRKKSEENVTQYPDDLSDRGSFTDDIENKILVNEIVKDLKREERFIFDRMVTGYTFEEIAVDFGRIFRTKMSPVALRVRYHRAIAQLAVKHRRAR